MDEKFKVTFGDGLNPDCSLSLSGKDMRRVIRDSLWSGVVSSNAIEGVDISESTPPDPAKLPATAIITTD